MHAEVISIGDELTSGQRLDTNSQWLSERLGELGIQVMYHTTVADDLAANVLVFRQAAERADVVVASGGLGPTADDLTREALAQMAGVELVVDEASLAHIRSLFARHKRDMPERNRLQAMFPAGSTPIFNPNGTAPGIHQHVPRVGKPNSQIFALPGVPAEMKEMFMQSVAPALLAMGGAARVIRHRRIKCFGVGESHLEQKLPDLIRRGRQPAVGITVHAATITLRITAEGASPDECFAAMGPTIATIYECLGNLVYGEEDDELEDAVVRLLGERGRTLATAEWGTRGMLANVLGNASLATDEYLAGLVLKNTGALRQTLGERADLIDQHGHASAPVAEALATRIRQQYGADYGLAVGPFPLAPAGDTAGDSAEPAEYFFALAMPEKVMVRSSTLASHPSIWIPRAAKQALNLLRLELIDRSAGRA